MSERGIVRELLPPLALFLALLFTVGGFTLLWRGGPETPTELHRARIAGDEDLAEVLEAAYAKKKNRHTTLIVCSFVLAGVSAASGYLGMRPSGPR